MPQADKSSSSCSRISKEELRVIDLSLTAHMLYVWCRHLRDFSSSLRVAVQLRCVKHIDLNPNSPVHIFLYIRNDFVLPPREAGYRLVTTYWCNSYFTPYSCKERTETTTATSTRKGPSGAKQVSEGFTGRKGRRIQQVLFLLFPLSGLEWYK